MFKKWILSAVVLGFVFSTAPAFAGVGDACTTANRVHTSEGPTTDVLICDAGTMTLKTARSLKTNPVREGIATASPEAALDVAGEIKIGNTSLACSATTEGAIRYNSAGSSHEFCDGATWQAFVGVQPTSPPTAPAGAGYFVMTATTWNSGFGGLTGADANCLTEISTTYTDWNGYTDANTRGLLTGTKVKAFLCDRVGCNNLMPLTTYYFATAGDSAAGGASFTTDASGDGPNNAAIWSAANYFSGSYEYWTGRLTGSSTIWGSFSSTAGDSDFGWVNGSGINTAITGIAASTASDRWSLAPKPAPNNYSLICFVNP